MYVDPEIMTENANDFQKKTFVEMQQLIKGIRRDTAEGIFFRRCTTRTTTSFIGSS